MLTPYQINLLKRVKERILAHPEGYDQNHWCGTRCCIAGHLVAEAGLPAGDAYTVNTAAYRLLDHANEMYYGPSSVAELFSSAQSWAKNDPHEAARRIDYFIKANTP